MSALDIWIMELEEEKDELKDKIAQLELMHQSQQEKIAQLESNRLFGYFLRLKIMNLFKWWQVYQSLKVVTLSSMSGV